MKPNKKFAKLATGARIMKAAAALEKNGISTIVVATGAEARQKLLEMIPQGAEVMNETSVTLETIGVPKEIVESGRYDSVRKRFMSMDRNKDASQMRKLGAAPDYVMGSVHAVTEQGEVMVASQGGSQLPAYAYGAGKVIWVVGAQKIVKNFAEGLKRLYEYSLPLEEERAQKAYGVGSGVNKILVINREVKPGRITMIIVKEKLGF